MRLRAAIGTLSLLLSGWASSPQIPSISARGTPAKKLVREETELIERSHAPG